MKDSFHQRSVEVGAYYDKWHARYMDVYGEFIQAFRPSSDRLLTDYLANTLELKDGFKLLDAGCGVGATAISFAKRFNIQCQGITISPAQVKQAEINLSKLDASVSARINFQLGDYHLLDEMFPSDSFDVVTFIESLGHAAEPSKVIKASFQVLKQGGLVYIKDFFPRETADSTLQERIAKTIANINREYCYNVLNLNETLSSLRQTGFAIESIQVPKFETDISIRSEFEERFGIEIFEGGEFMPAEWFEIKCRKLFLDSGE